MAGRGEVCGLPPGVDRGVQVRGVPGSLKPGAQGDAQVRQVPGEARVAGRGGGHRVPERCHRGVERRGASGSLVFVEGPGPLRCKPLRVADRLCVGRRKKAQNLLGYPFRRPAREHAEKAERRSQVILVLPLGQRLAAGQVQARQHREDIHGNCLRITARRQGSLPQSAGLV